MNFLYLGLTFFFIILNGFFVAAEFALVKLTKSKIRSMVKEDKAFATTALWLYNRQNLTLSACQLGITMASLALGWVGEPALASLITPLIHKIGITSESLIHGISFVTAFSIITCLHIVIGEQVPKIYAIRKPGPVFLGSALVLKFFYKLLYVFVVGLDKISNFFLKKLGIDDAGGHESVLNEEEIRASLSIAHAKGELSKNEHRLLNAVFKFDDEVAKQIMRPRSDIDFMDINKPFSENLAYVKRSRHSRFPLCEGSLDKLLGIVHIKDLIGFDDHDSLDLKEIARPVMRIPENILIGKLLQEFRQAKQHLAFIEDEHGTLLGIVTLEDVLEELVGNLEDEFDEPEEQHKLKDGQVVVNGQMTIEQVNTKFNMNLISDDSDTVSGLIVELHGHKLEKNKFYRLGPHVEAQILEIDGIRAKSVKLQLKDEEET